MNEKQIGKFIKEKRIEKNLTQEELAEKLYISNKAVSKWEQGKCMPSIDLLIPLCKELDVELNELLEGKNIEHQKESYEKLLLKVLKRKKRAKYNLWINIFLCLILCALETVLYIGNVQESIVYIIFLLFFIILGLFDIYDWLIYKNK